MTAPRRLNALDAAFVSLDGRGSPYHVGGVLVFDRIDVGLLRKYVAACLDRLPEYRMRIERVPLLGHPVWVDDPALDVDRQIVVEHLPPPGSSGQLDEIASRIFSEDLPPDRPPWRIWVVDGLEAGRVALVSKVHHCLLDGISGVRLLETLLRGTPDSTIPERLPHAPETPRRRDLLLAELRHRGRGLLELPTHVPGDLRSLAPALLTLIRRGLHPASEAGINPKQVGRSREIRGWRMEVADILAIKHREQVTFNDVVLAIASGALRRFLARRGVDVARLGDFRAMVPVSMHERGETALAGNRVALLLVRLPVDEPDPKRRIQLISATTRDRRGRAQEAIAGELLVQLSDVTVPGLLAGILDLSTDRRGFNVVITNVPAPPFPLYLLGARLRSFRPIVNLWPGQGLGIALLSYDGTLFWGLHADRAVVPALDELVTDLQASLDELRAISATPKATGTSRPSPPSP